MEEADDLRTSRRFRPVPHGFEGKLFATTREDAIWWGEMLYSSLGQPFKVVEVNLDRPYLDTLPLVDPKPDGRPAIHPRRPRAPSGVQCDLGADPGARRPVRPAAIPARAYIRARIRLQSTADGGRLAPILSGYRPGFVLGDGATPRPAVQNDAAIFLVEGATELAPGESGMAWLQPLVPEHWKSLAPKAIPFYEGNRLVGVADVIEIRSDLGSPAK